MSYLKTYRINSRADVQADAIKNNIDYFTDSNISTPTPPAPRLYNVVSVLVPTPDPALNKTATTGWTLVTESNYTQYTDLILNFVGSVYLRNDIETQAQLDNSFESLATVARTIVPCSTALCDLDYANWSFVVIKYATEPTEALTTWVSQNYHSCFIANSYNEGLYAVTKLLIEDGVFPNIYQSIKGLSGFSGVTDNSIAESYNQLGYSVYAVTKQEIVLDYFNIAGIPAQVAYGTAYLNYNIKVINLDLIGKVYDEKTAEQGRLRIENFLKVKQSEDQGFISNDFLLQGTLERGFTVNYSRVNFDTMSKKVGKIVYNVKVWFNGYVHRVTLNLASEF